MNKEKYCLRELDGLASRYAKKMESRGRVGLVGALGAGKTKFTAALAKTLGIKDVVSSPTFTIMQTYKGAGKKLLHIDLYRVHPEDRETIDQIIEEIAKHRYVIVEWADKIRKVYKKLDFIVKFSHLGKENERSIEEVG